MRHFVLDAAGATPMGKVGGVLAGLREAAHETVVVADDDVRWTAEQLGEAARRLPSCEVLRPQNWFDPQPWHARWDTGRMLLNRVSGGDWPGTLVVDWVERRSQEWAGEYEEILGYHLEQAYRARVELGPPTAHTRAQASRAATLLASAGRRAFSRGDMPAAVNLLSRATTLSDAEDPQRLDLLPRLAFALMETGNFERLMEVVGEAREAATVSGDRSLLSHATILELYVRLFTSPESWVEEGEREARTAIAEFERLGDHGGLAKAWSLLGLVNVTKSRFAPAQEAWERAAAHAEQAGERRDQLEALSWALLSAWAGPAPLVDGLHRCHAVLEAAGTDHKARATAMFMRALHEAGLGNIQEARRLTGQARALLEEVAMTTWMAGPMTQIVGLVELTAGDPATAERALRWGDETLQTIGEVGWRPTLVALLAEAVYEQDRHEEAGVLAKACQDMAGGDDV